MTSQPEKLTKHNHSINLLNDLAELLQKCHTGAEAFLTCDKVIGRLFTGDSGSLFTFRSSQNLLEAVTVWGEAPPEKQVFAPHDCWALRRWQALISLKGAEEPRCAHVHDPIGNYLCIPMKSHGQILGLLHVLSASQNEDELEKKLQLAIGVANVLGLTLANLKLQEALHYQAIRDPLTGLFTRLYMEEALEREFLRATRMGTPISLIILDIDHFKRCIAIYGHDAGDVLLKEVSTIPQRYLRDSDVICHYEGDKFILMLPECTLEIACQRAEEMRQAIKSLQVQYGNQTLEANTLSCGVAAFPNHGDNPDTVLLAAMEAVYRAKQEGCDRVVVADWSLA